MTKNKKIAELLEEMGDILELQGVKFKPKAYRNAAMAIESLSEDIADIAKQREVDDIPGVGKSITAKIHEFLKTGHIKELDKLRKKVPVKIRELRSIEGVGPKTIKKLYKKFGVKTRKELEEAAKKHKIRKLKGFGKTVETRIIESIKFAKKTKGRALLSFALPEAENIISQMKKAGVVNKISMAGSLRRRKPTIGDIDILATSKNPKKAIEFFTKKLKGISRISAKGSTKASIRLKSGFQVDLRILDDKSWGSGLQYFTGSKKHGIHVRQIAIKKGYKLSEYGLFKKKKMIAGGTEESIYKKLGMQYIPPEIRRDTGEIEAALKKKLPKLVEIKDVKGDLHAHTKWSDGKHSIKEMALAAKKLGLRYITITDHTGSLAIAGGIKGKKLLEQIKEVKKVNKQVKGIRMFSGAEVNIKADGSVDISDQVLKKLDVVIASIHTGQQGSKAKLTSRICRAMENPHVDIIGHLTGRKLKKKEAYPLDFDKICKVARRTKTCLEVNATPERLDLNEDMIRKAVEKKVKLAIGTDSHSTEHFRFLEYGAYHARRGWCSKKDLANTRSAGQVLKFLK